ncbi:uroporphyrinogen-III synthase [Methyloligella sp. 2.7D]|uniref:uroporphyrinogen-III synthase n=1 Tax=unclassified Methyloligella TaxID=2625955 RepID=UPI00157DA891|nr:uroporphyrinogen-III synthase [Methyloligella sp. GL2]QKP76182.1 uroporphyrinogen-III synthase [Methyloligella sp. GL2]
MTRPEPDAEAQAEKLRRLGHVPVLSPLSKIVFLGPPLALHRAQALAVTSRNALRAIETMPQAEALRKFPLFAVGPATASMARQLGFTEVIQGPGTGKQLAALIRERLDPRRGSLIHLAGADLAHNLQYALEGDGFTVEVPVVYRAEPIARFSDAALAHFSAQDIDGVLLMSPRGAETFARLAKNAGIATDRLQAFCISVNVARNLEDLGCKIAVAAKPDEEELLALLPPGAPSS